MIPEKIKVKNKELPDLPGVYFYFDADDKILYIGKATSLKRRVNSYFTKAHDNRIAEMVSTINRIDYLVTPTVIEALVLEANKIKEFVPPYNILQRDGKSFLYLVITNEDFPKPLLVRGGELRDLGIDPFQSSLSIKAKRRFLAVYGPYTSGTSLKKALEFIRKIIPWSICEPPDVTKKSKPCFYRHIKKCPGVCSGEIDKKTYRKIIKRLMLFFEGKKVVLISSLKKEMIKLAKEKKFELAGQVRNRIYALEHIQDVAMITKEDVNLPFTKQKSESKIDIMGRIEAYDISNISGVYAVGSMVVFEDGIPVKTKYRKFRIKTVVGANDVAMMEEIIRRRLKRGKIYPKAWQLPEIMVIDGGEPQVNRVQKILREFNMDVPVVGLAKGVDRKQDRLVFDRQDIELAKVVTRGKVTFQKARDEAHRFAVKYHREVRRRASMISKSER